MRLLGVDFGFKRIGLAVVDSDIKLPAPRPTLAASGKLKNDAQTLHELAKKEQANAIVIGLPVEPDGSEGRMARICRQLAGQIEALGTTVHFVDERLTSIEAEQNLFAEDLKASQRKKRLDSEAACLILERYLHDQKAN